MQCSTKTETDCKYDAFNGGTRGRGKLNVNQPPICRFYDGSDVSCTYGADCHFLHVISQRNKNIKQQNQLTITRALTGNENGL